MTLSTMTDRPLRAEGLIRRHRHAVGATVASLALLAATACGGPATGGSAGGEGVEAGAPKEDFRAALTDMDPVELKVQVLAPKGTGYAQAWEDYGKALDEWSGGKITVKMHYSGSIVPTDVSGALADGLIDAAPIQPSFEPDKFPIAAWTNQRMVLNENTPIAGTLQQIGSVAEVGVDDEAMTQEIVDQGIHPLIPAVVNGSINLMCGTESANSLSELKGTQVRAATKANEHEVKALGASPVSLPTLEVFEGVQRGTVDCTATPHTSAYTMNLAEVAKNWVVDPEVGLAPTSETMAVSLSTWEELPLAGQQLMHDRLDVFLKTYFTDHVLGGITATMQQAEDNDVTIEPFEDDARTKLQDYQRSTVEKDDAPDGYDGAAFGERMEESNEEWAGKVEDLGYGENIAWEDFAAHQKKDPTDMQPLVDELLDSVLAEHRPA